MASVQVLPLANYPSGTRTIGPVDIADDVTGFDFSIQRNTTATPTIWDNPNTTLDLAFEASVDGGATWIPRDRYVASGGIGRDKHGNEQAFGICGGPLVAGTNRKYRIISIIANGPLRSTATVEVY